RLSAKRFFLLVAALLVVLGGAADGEARLSRTLLDLGYDREARLDGADAAFSAFFPMPAMSRVSGEMLWKIAPSAALLGNGTFSFFLNDRLILTRSVEALRKEPLVRLPLPADLRRDRFLHARIESRIGITDDVCRDLFSGQLFWIVQEDSGFSLDDLRISHRSVSDFFETLYGSLSILLPASPSREEAEAAVWLAAMLRKAVPGLSVSLDTNDNGRSASSSFILIAGDAIQLPSGIQPLPGLSLLGERGLLVLGDGKPASLAGFVKTIASFPLFAAIPSGSILPETSAASEKNAVSNLLNLAEGTGANAVSLEIPVFPGLLASPPQDLSFQLEGACTLPRDPARPARLDVFWNGVFIESEYLSANGRFEKRLLLPVETPLLTENRLR
ncbi:MAG: cellulose biosynthesis cyclic di-GMP-binding regulatory protein BcsB, partial [Synergistaceae bacterium]|nr:cellulose biosynthesis cyclic di-GMP-binding regulatory protein BcsB [Synergistaceae bacterium]